MNDEKLNSILEKSRILTANASDPAIMELLSPFGYTAERLAQGVALYNETSIAFQIQKKEYTDQYYAVSAFLSAFDAARKSFSDICKIARIAFKDNVEGLRLIPVRTKIQSYSEFKTIAASFYRTVIDTEPLMSALQNFGYSDGQLTEALTALTTLEQLSQKRYLEEGEAQTATDNRNRKLEELREYCSALKTVAKVALASQPQQLEKLGILARNSAPQKAATATPTATEPIK